MEIIDFLKFVKHIMTAKNIYLLFMFLLYSIIPISLVWLGNKSIINLGLGGIIFYSAILYLPILFLSVSICYIVLKNISVKENNENPLEFDVRYLNDKQLLLNGTFGVLIASFFILIISKYNQLNFSYFYWILLSFLTFRLTISYLLRNMYRKKKANGTTLTKSK